MKLNSHRSLSLAAGLLLLCGFLLFSVTFGPGVIRLLSSHPDPTPDFAGTIQAMIPTLLPTKPPGAQLASPAADQAAGQIVFTCQIFKSQGAEQICIMNADGSGFRRLTPEDNIRHFYPSLAPDGASVVYSQYREDNVYEIYQMSLADGLAKRLTDRWGALTGPEISPNGKAVVFMRWTVVSDQDQIWVMPENGGMPRQVIEGTGWDPTWSPDGTQILFASDRSGSSQLWIVNLDGTGLHQVGSLPALRGRSDWSPLGQIVTYSGQEWHRELYIMDTAGLNLRQLSPSGGDSQGPSFSPDGRWVAFTAYFDHPGDINGCEIYILRIDGSDLRRLTNNDYCDYQPRWGP